MKRYDESPEPIGGYTAGRTQMDFEYTAWITQKAFV